MLLEGEMEEIKSRFYVRSFDALTTQQHKPENVKIEN